MNPTYDQLMKFAIDFSTYYEEMGIKDSLDRQTNTMVTSKGVYDLVKQARLLTPERKPRGVSAKEMREMEDSERLKAIENSDNVIDMRTTFAKRMAENGSSRGLIEIMVDAYKRGDTGAFAQALANMSEFVKIENGE